MPSRSRTSGRTKVAGTMLLLWLAMACNTAKPTSPPAVLKVRRKRPHAKPGDSISKTQMCSCIACEPKSCCKELDQDAPKTAKDCAQGYDFSKCEMAVSSCKSRCFRHRWRTEVDTGCEATRPDRCCHATAAF